MEYTAPERVTNMTNLVENALVRLFSDTKRGTKKGSDTCVVLVIWTVENRPAAKAFPSSAFQAAVPRAVQKSLVKAHVINGDATCIIVSRVSTASPAKFVENGGDRCSLEKPELR